MLTLAIIVITAIVLFLALVIAPILWIITGKTSQKERENE